MTKLIRELIDLPEQVLKGDFVLRLTEGIQEAEKTLGSYVVTPQLTKAFDDAIGFIKGATSEKSSKACYLHGSFGSGKSHFMAVLDLLLQGNTLARKAKGLEDVVAKHTAFLGDRKFLLVPYHMIGARSFEEGLLGGYVDHVAKKHPEVAPPGVYLAEKLLADAARHRQDLGDERFFARLNEGKSAGSRKWGKMESGLWDPKSFEEAARAPARDERRGRLVADLVKTFFSSYGSVARGAEQGFVGIDDGLSLISKHAKSLGYDAVILFLDELVLWLASRIADMDFVTREGQKLSKLIEASNPDRPVPLISFVARQRDLRELVGEHVPGAEQLSFADTLKWWEGRFHKITLEDRNLPLIAERRILKPKDDAARREIQDAFDQSSRLKEDVLGTLLGKDGNRQEFRQVYPFSPALVQTLVALSSALQRERTALKIMLMLLVEQRDRLELGQIVPVGDLYDIIAEGDEPFSTETRKHFELAKRLYRQKLEPLLQRIHGCNEEAIAQGRVEPAVATSFRNDARILKTMILASLAPDVEALKDLTPRRLAALNHGSIKAAIPGKEAQALLAKLRQWAGQVGELKIGEEDSANPIVSLQITGVDTDAILEKAAGVDNPANRIGLLRDLVFKEMGIRNEDSLLLSHEWIWRGTKRSVEIAYCNIREIRDDAILEPDGPGWKLVIDFPFDHEGHGPRDDLSKIEDYCRSGKSALTVCWVPSFFSRPTIAELGKLVRIRHVLAGERFDLDYASHLSVTDRAQARRLLEGQQRQLEARIRDALLAAYGLIQNTSGVLDDPLPPSEQFKSLDGSFRPRPPVAATLADALTALLDQMMGHCHPAHPTFKRLVRSADLRKVYEALLPAVELGEVRVDGLERATKELLSELAQPLGIGEQHEGPFVIKEDWRTHFAKEAGREPGEVMTVGRLRAAIEKPKSMGLPRSCENLLIMLHAAATRSSFIYRSGAHRADVDQLPDETELRGIVLPSVEAWKKAGANAVNIFGIVADQRVSSSAVAELEDKVAEKLREHRQAAIDLHRQLVNLYHELGLPADSERLTTASAVLDLVESLTPGRSLVETLAAARIATSAAAMGTSLKSARSVGGAILGFKIDLVQALEKLGDEKKVAAAGLREALNEAVQSDEYVNDLTKALRAAEKDAVRILTELPDVRPNPRPEPRPEPGPEWVRVLDETSSLESVEALEAKLEKIRQELARGDRRVTLHWILDKRKGS